MIIIALLLLIAYSGLFIYTIHAISKGKLQEALFYTVIFFPIYALFLSFTYSSVESPLLAKLIQYSKEIVVFSAILIFIFGRENLLNKEWHISLLDKVFLSFMSLTLVYFIIGIGEATVFNRAIYVKNILLIGAFYFLGRNVKMEFKDWNRIFQIIFVITVLASGLVILEKLSGTHFHTFAGYAKYNLDVNGEEPTGLYGLTWTFEAEGGRKRFGSFFANPLELSSSMLITTAACVIFLISVPFKANKYKYLAVLASAFFCVLFAYSRASFMSFFLMLFFIAFLMRYYKILGYALGAFIVLGLYILFFAADEVLFFVIDTLTFQNSSSLTHIMDWLNAIESIVSYPMGIGLAMSGNAGGVEKDLMVGGENQFLVYGVQLGVLGALLYISMLYFGIRNSWRAFRLAKNRQQAIVPFVAASVKFGLLLPLMTANAEVYIYVSLVSWWMIGTSESLYQSRRKLAILARAE